VRATIHSSLGKFTETPDGTLFEWPIDDLEYGARYLIERGLPFAVKDPPEFRDTLRSLANEVSLMAEAT
jgi:hypothetical protein